MKNICTRLLLPKIKTPIKTNRAMKLTCALLLTASMGVFATGNAQTMRVNIQADNVSTEKILSEIEKQTDYLFVYNKNEVDLKRKTSVNAVNKTTAEVLSTIFNGTDIIYAIEGENIMLMRKEKNLAVVPDAVQQDNKITGTVLDPTGMPVIGANIMVKGTTNGTITDMDGKFSLEAREGAVLVVSYIGFANQEIKIGKQKQLSIALKEDSQALDELVVVGYGTQKKVNLTGSVATIKNEELVKTPVASTTNALVGRMPGLIAKQNTGQPGYDASDLQIRGFGSALVIVDGVEQSFNNIDANEIESISILKDASAAIYGARAGNGVILVTTKRGNTGKPMVSFNGTWTAQSFTNFTEPVGAGEYATITREAELNSGKPEDQLSFTEEDIAKYFAGTDPQYPNTSWYDEIMRKSALQQQYNLSIRGGSNSVKYYTFLSYLDQDGMIKGDNTGFRRYNVRSNLDVNLTSDLKLSLDLAAIKEDVRQSSRDVSSPYFWLDLYDSKPIYPASYPDKSKLPFNGTGATHVLTNCSEELGGYNKQYSTSLNGAFTVDYKIPFVQGLSAKLKMNYRQVMVENKKWVKENTIWQYDYNNDIYQAVGNTLPTSLNQQHSKFQTITGQFSLNYDRTFNEDHLVNGLLLFELIDNNDNNFSAYRENYITSAIDQLFAGGTINQNIGGSATTSGRASIVGRINYAYKSKYLAEFTARYDGSPNFPKNKRWGFFPSVSLGWRLSEETFMDSLNWLDNLKLRVGVSQTGFDSVGAYQYLVGYKFTGYNVIGGLEVPGLHSTGLSNPNITWETMTLYNVGFDFSGFNNRLYSEVDVFYRKRDDMLGTRAVSLPNTFGAVLPSENINSQGTRGFEFLLGYRGNIGEFQYDISGNISWARSKWIHFDEPLYTDPDDIRIKKISGQWTDRRFAYRSDGLFTSQEEIDNLGYDMDNAGNTTLHPGDIKLIDLNKDGKIDWRDQDEIGSGQYPHIIYGININLKYKDFDLSLLGQGAADYYVSIDPGSINFDGLRTPYKVVWEERWTPENNDRDAIIPRQTVGQLTNNWASDYWYKNASYFRLKNITLGYSLNRNIIKRIGMESLRFYITGVNLFTINPLKKYGLDPENIADGRQTGWSYPVTKSISLGVNVNF